MNARTNLFSVLGLTVAMFAAGAMAIGDDKEKKGPTGAKIGEAAPAWTLTDIKGKEWKSTDQAGKIVVLEWVNPQCPVCRGAPQGRPHSQHGEGTQGHAERGVPCRQQLALHQR